MKQLLCIFFLSFSTIVFAQNTELPPNPEAGKCYVRCKEDGKFVKWEEINCDYIVYSKDKEKLKTLQIKLSNLKYDVEVTGENDAKTINAYKRYLKDEKKRLRRSKRKKKQD